MKRSVSVYRVATCLLAAWLVTGCDKSPTTSDHITGPRFAAAGPVSQLVFTVQPSTAAAGAAITPAVQVTAQDAQGNTVTTYTAKITVALGTNPTNAKLGGTVTVSAKSGVATFANLSITKAATGYALSATSGTLTAGTSSPFDITPGPTSKIMFTVQPTPTAAGDPITPAVQVSAEDGFNNVATPFAGTISLALKSCSAGAILAGTATATAQYGVATFADLSINKSGNCSLKATSGSFTATSATFVIGPAAPASLQFLVQPSKTKAGVAINPTVKVTARDRFGNTASGFNGQVVMSIASGPAGVPLLGTTTVTAVSGTASFTNLIVQKVGAYVLQASATGLTAVTSNGFLVVPNFPTHLAFTVQPSTTAPGAVITPSVQVTVRDAYDNPVPITGSVTVAIGSNPGGGTLSGTLAKSAAATGVAIFDDLSINNAGAGYTLVATLGTLPSATSAPFDIIGVAAQIAVQAGDGQTANVSSAVPIPPAVVVRDQFGSPVPGWSVTFAVASGGGSVTGANATTNTSGIATVGSWTLGSSPGSNTLTATASGSGIAGNPVTFTATAAGPSDAWTAETPMPTARWALGAAAINGTLYAVGGSGSGVLEAYDPATSSWITKAPMPTPRGFLGVVAVNGTLYAVGGRSTGNVDVATLEAYDPATDTWTTKAPMPTARTGLGVTAINGILYAVGGGDNSGTTLATLEAYDPSTDTWTTKAPMPTARHSLAVTALNGMLYAIGGTAIGANDVTTVEVYDPGSDTWSTRSPMPTGRELSGAVALNGSLYVVGGLNQISGLVGLATVEGYDPGSDTWSTKATMPTPRLGLGAATLNGSVYAVGGYSNGPLATLEAYHP